MYRNPSEEVLNTSYAGQLGMAQGSSQVSSQELHTRALRSDAPMERIALLPDFDSLT